MPAGAVIDNAAQGVIPAEFRSDLDRPFNRAHGIVVPFELNVTVGKATQGRSMFGVLVQRVLEIVGRTLVTAILEQVIAIDIRNIARSHSGELTVKLKTDPEHTTADGDPFQ